MTLDNPRHLIIYSSGGGRTCDQLMTLAQFAAFAEEYGDEFAVIDIPFWPFSSGFEAFRQNRIVVVPPRVAAMRLPFGLGIVERMTRTGDRQRSIIRKGQNRLRSAAVTILERSRSIGAEKAVWIAGDSGGVYDHLRGNRSDFLNIADPEVVADFRTREITVICGPKVRCWDLVKKHHEAARFALRIRSDIIAKAREFIADLRSRHDYLIGVMVRQGDYRQYANGRYFFSSQQYARWMASAREIFGSKGKVGFVIASDEAQNPSVFEGLPYHFTTGIMGASGHYLESLAELGMCDVILTTGSSFGCWSAFAGNIPILPLFDPSQRLHTDDLVYSLWDCTLHSRLNAAIW